MSMTSAYDPARHDNQVVAMYETDAQARAAEAALRSSGVPGSAIQVVAQQGSAGAAPGTEQEGVWGAIRSLFVPDDDRAAYSHAVGHGHAMVVVTMTGGADRGNVIHVLEGTNPIDFDAKMQDWTSSGYDHTTPHADYLASTQVGSSMASTAAASKGFDTRMGSTTPMTAAAPVGKDKDTIEVIEERLRVGKREVAAGAVRVRSYIVERPVEEQVRLREEHIAVDRHPVDQPAGSAAFQERTIEARAMSEKAVVSKEARVVEEIALRKEATDRVETVHDTVRRTEVEVEDGTTTSKPTR